MTKAPPRTKVEAVCGRQERRGGGRFCRSTRETREAAIDTEPASNEGAHGANPNRPTFERPLLPLEDAPSFLGRVLGDSRVVRQPLRHGAPFAACRCFVRDFIEVPPQVVEQTILLVLEQEPELARLRAETARRTRRNARIRRTLTPCNATVDASPIGSIPHKKRRSTVRVMP